MAKNNLPSVEVEAVEDNGSDKGYITVKILTVIGDPHTGTFRSWGEFRTTGKTREDAALSIIERTVLKPAGITFEQLDDTVFDGSLVYTADGVTTIINPMDGAAGRDSQTGMIDRPAWLRLSASGGALTKAGLLAKLGKK